MKKIMTLYITLFSLGLGAWAMEEKEEQTCQDTSSQHSSFTQNTQEGQQSSKDYTVFGQTSIWGFTAQELKEIPLVKDLEQFNLNFSKIQRIPVAEGTNLGTVIQIKTLPQHELPIMQEILLIAEKDGNTQKIIFGDTVFCYIWNKDKEKCSKKEVGFSKTLIDTVKQGKCTKKEDYFLTLDYITDTIKPYRYVEVFSSEDLAEENMRSIFEIIMMQHVSDRHKVWLDKYFVATNANIIKHYNEMNQNQPTFRKLWQICKSKEDYIDYCKNTWNMPDNLIPPYPVGPLAPQRILNNFPVELFIHSNILPQTYFQTGQLNADTPLTPEGDMFVDQLVCAKKVGLLIDVQIDFLFSSLEVIDPRKLVQGVAKMLQMGLSLDETPSNIRSLTFCETKWTLDQIQAVQSMQGILKGSVGKKQWNNDFTLRIEQQGTEEDIVPFDHCNSSLFCWKKTRGAYENFVISAERNTLFFNMLRVAQNNYKLIYRKEIIWDLFEDCFMPHPKDNKK